MKSARRVLWSARHFLVGDMTPRMHGRRRVLYSLALSLLVFPISLGWSMVCFLKCRRMVIGIAQNGHSQASHFIQDFEPLNRRHLAGEFGDARVVFVVDRVPLGPKLWDEVRAGSMLEVPVFPRLYRCMPANRYVTRVYLTVSTNTADTRRGFALSDAGSPCRGAPPPVALAEIGLGDLPTKPFTLMQVQRPEMFWGLQRSKSKRIVEYAKVSDENFPNLKIYREVQDLLLESDYPVIDLWNTVGDPSKLFGKNLDEASLINDRIQTWLFSNCEVFLSGASGAWWIAWALGRPTLVTNMYVLPTDLPISMCLPKMLWDREERRLRTLSESGTRGLAGILNRSPARFEVVSNTPEEIAEAVIELRSITRGETEIDTDLQMKVAQLVQHERGEDKAIKPMPILGQGFLRRHPEIIA